MAHAQALRLSYLVLLSLMTLVVAVSIGAESALLLCLGILGLHLTLSKDPLVKWYGRILLGLGMSMFVVSLVYWLLMPSFEPLHFRFLPALVQRAGATWQWLIERVLERVGWMP